MSSLDKMLGLLDLAGETRPSWSIEEAIAETGLPRSTLYRYCQSLVRAGLLEGVGQGRYGLGSRLMDLDRRLRLACPLTRAARRPMADLARRARLPVLLLRLRGDELVCLHDELPPTDLLAESRRGVTAGLFSGAAGNMLLAGLTAATRRRRLAAAGRQADAALLVRLDTARRDGWIAGPDEALLGPGRWSLVAGLPGGRADRLVALALALPDASATEGRPPETRHVELLRDAAQQVAALLPGERAGQPGAAEG